MNMTSVEKTIRVLERQCEAYEADIAALQARRDETFTLITGLRRAAGVIEPVAPAKATTRAKKASGKRTASISRGGRQNLADNRQVVLDAIRSVGKPISPGDLADTVGITRHAVTRHLKALQASGAVVMSGATLDRRVSLAGAKSTPPTAPVPPAPPARQAAPHTSRAGMASPAPADAVRARDAAIEKRLGQGPATLAQLLIAMPHEPELDEAQRKKACENAILRLRTKGVISHSDAGGYQLVR